jgi:hypothetical protein
VGAGAGRASTCAPTNPPTSASASPNASQCFFVISLPRPPWIAQPSSRKLPARRIADTGIPAEVSSKLPQSTALMALLCHDWDVA